MDGNSNFGPLPGDRAETKVGNAGQGLLPTGNPSGSAAIQVGFGVTKPDLIRSGALRPSVTAQRSI